MTPPQLAREWVAAVNAQNVLAVMARSARDIVVGGPRGTSRGQPALREWVERAGVQMTVLRAFASGPRVVFLCHAIWRDRVGLTVAEATVANRFDVADDRVTAVVRYDALADALRDAGLTEADEEIGTAEGAGPA